MDHDFVGKITEGHAGVMRDHLQESFIYGTSG